MYQNWTCLDCDVAEKRGASPTEHQQVTGHMIVPKAGEA